MKGFLKFSEDVLVENFSTLGDSVLGSGYEKSDYPLECSFFNALALGGGLAD